MTQRVKLNINYEPKKADLIYSSPKNARLLEGVEKIPLRLEMVRDRVNYYMNKYESFIGGTYIIEPIKTMRKPSSRSIYRLMFLSAKGEAPKHIVTGNLHEIDKVILGYRLKDEEIIE
jgi:hypothetical protein